MKQRTAFRISIAIILVFTLIGGFAIVRYWFPEEPLTAAGGPSF